MKPHVIITRGAAVGIIISWLGLAAAVLWMFVLNNRLHDQQAQDKRLIEANSHTVTLVCKFATGFALYQPNLDPQVLRIINEVVGELPAKCFP